MHVGTKLANILKVFSITEPECSLRSLQSDNRQVPYSVYVALF
jgi:hypothetical protein